MKRITLLLFLFLLGISTLFAQDKEGVTTSGRLTGQLPFPVTSYEELPNPASPHSEDWQGHKGIRVSWGTTDIRYKKEKPMPIKQDKMKLQLHGWRGERVAAQWVVSAYTKSTTLSYEVSDFINTKNHNQKIGKNNLLTGFVRYVMTDELNKDGKGGCGYRKPSDFDSSLSADVIDPLTTSLELPLESTRPGWVRVWIPRDIHPGTYQGTITIKGDEKVLGKLQLSIVVDQKQLPKPADWSFHLDLWQNPYAVARYYGVKPWSKAHFKHLKEDMQHYVNAGGKVITASIIHKPWDGQTYDDFETMITWMKRADGSWYFDYTIFDKWVQFMMDLGVDQQINCYSMIPWKLSFQYYDQATNSLKYIKAQPGDSTYAQLWKTMLTSFAKHLKEKGWFKKTYIAMDERPLKDMEAALKVIYEADKNYKVALAGNLHPELVDKIDDYCISYGQHFTSEMLEKRDSLGMKSTYYTSCSQPYPNTFTFSPPAQAEWLAWYAAGQHLDGYLRWAYNSWVIEPLLDSRFTTWAAGDTYLVYPGGRTSIRFEKLVEEIQEYEKINLLRKTLHGRKLKKLQDILDGFTKLDPAKESAGQQIRKAKEAIRKL